MDHVESGEVNQVCNAMVIDSLRGMNRKFATPFVIYTPRQGRSRGSLPPNRTIRDMVDGKPGAYVWLGDAVVVKYDATPFGMIVDCTSSDFPLVRNWLINQARES